MNPILLRPAVLAVSVAIALTACVTGAKAQQASPAPGFMAAKAIYRADELKLTLQTEKKAYQQGEKIQLILAVENISQKNQRVVAYSFPQYSYWIKATDEARREVGSHVDSGLGRRDGIMLPGNAAHVLAPGQKWTEKIELDRNLKLPGVGRYHLRAWRFPLMFTRVDLERALRAGKPLNFENSIESNEIEFEVLPERPAGQ